MTDAAILTLTLLLQALPQEVVIHSHPYFPPATSALTVETNLVETGLVIRDNRGKPIGGFRAADFEVLDNGKPQEILSFSEARLPEPGEPPPASTTGTSTAAKGPSVAFPRAVSLFFDDLHTETAPLIKAVAAARTFVASALAPSDRVSIVTSSNSVGVDFTTDRATLEAILDRIRTHTRPPVASCPALQPVDAYFFVQNLDADTRSKAIEDAKVCICGPTADRSCLNSRATTLAAPGVAGSAAETVWSQTELQSKNTIAALGSALQRLTAEKGPRVMVLISSGFLPPLQKQLDLVATGALRWNIVIHSLDAKGLDAELETLKGTGYDNLHAGRTRLTRQGAVWQPLEKIAEGTGGHFFRNTNDLAAALRMATAPAISYVLSFNPGGRDGQFHNLTIALRNKSVYSLQFRPGYDSPPDPKKEPSNRAALDAAVFSQDTLREIPAAVALTAGQPKDGTIPISVAVTLDLKHIEFAADGGRHVQQIVFLMTLLDARGTFVTGKEAVIDLPLTDQKLESLQKDGLKAVATLSVPAGIYQVRTIVREAMKGNLAASTVPVELRSK